MVSSQISLVRNIIAQVIPGNNGIQQKFFDKKTPGRYYGTGDVLASSMLGAILCGQEAGDAADTAVSFTARAIERTAQSGRNPIYGVDFELGLADYAMQMKKEREWAVYKVSPQP